MTLTRQQREDASEKQVRTKAKLKRYRDKRKRLGLMRVETWVRPEHAEAVRRFARETGYCSIQSTGSAGSR